MLTNLEIKEFVCLLLDCRTKLLWLVDHNPMNSKEEELIEHGRELLKKVNQALEELNIELPT